MELVAPTAPATRARRGAGFAVTVGTILLLAWMAGPTLAGQSNEGFQSTVILNARALLSGDYHGMDLLYPLDNDFFLLSRFGLALALAPLIQLGLSGEAAFRVVMILSLAALLLVNAIVLVRCYRVPPVLALWPSILFPGLFESAWFFNDNVLSAALSGGAIALFWTRRSLGATAGAGLLWGLAILCRTDALLLAPAFLVLLLSELPGWPARLRHGILAGLVATAVPFVAYAAFGLHFLDVFALSRRAMLAWDRKDPLSHMIHPVLKGIAYPGMVLLLAGAIRVVRLRQWREIGLCLAVPVLYAGAYGLMLTEVRYLLPLSPFLGILMVEGAWAIRDALPRRRRAALLLLGLAAALCILPPSVPPLHALLFLSTDNDMPRPSIGRLWSPVTGTWWNTKLAEGAAAAGPALEAAAAPGGPGIVVSTRWTPDRLVDLTLAEHGFTASRTEAPPECHDIAETFTRGPDRLLHLRVHIPMLPKERAAVTWQRLAQPCLTALGVAPQAPILVIGQALVVEPPSVLADPQVHPVYVPVVDIAPFARALASKCYAIYVATIPRNLVIRALAPPLDGKEEAGANAAIAARSMLQ